MGYSNSSGSTVLSVHLSDRCASGVSYIDFLHNVPTSQFMLFSYFAYVVKQLNA